MVTFLRHYTCGLCFLSVNLQKYVEQIYKLLFIMEFVMTELQIELSEAIKKIVSISERVKENPELGANLTYLFLAEKPGEEDGGVAAIGASPKEVVLMLASLMEEDETFRECVMIATAIVRMKSTIVGAMGGGVGGIGGLVGFMEFLKKNMDEKEESKSEAKEGSEGDAETV